MNKVDGLLAEARPLYHKRKRQLRFLSGAVTMCFLAMFSVGAFHKAPRFNDEAFYAYYTALYETEDAFCYDISEADFVPADGFGLIEVI